MTTTTSMEEVIELSSASDGEESLSIKFERNKRFRVIWRLATRMILTKITSESALFPYNGLRHLLVIIKEKTHDIKSVQLREFIFRKFLHFFEAVKFAYKGIGEDEKFNFLLVDFMVLYINLICDQYKQLNEDSTVISHLLNALHITFSGKSNFTILTLLKAKSNVVLHPIYKKYLLDRKLHDGYSMIRYIPLILCYRKWKKIESDNKMVSSEIDINRMLKGVPPRVPPVDNMNRCFTRICDLIGFAIQNGDQGTSILLENKSMDLEESIDKFFKLYGQYIARHCSFNTPQNLTLGDKIVMNNSSYPPSDTKNAVLCKMSDSERESKRTTALTVCQESGSSSSPSSFRRQINHFRIPPTSNNTTTQNPTTRTDNNKCDIKLSNQSETSYRSKQRLPRNRDNLGGMPRPINSRTSTSRPVNTSPMTSVNKSKPIETILIDSSDDDADDEKRNESPEGEVSSTTNWEDDSRQNKVENHAKELDTISQILPTTSTPKAKTSASLPRFNHDNSNSNSNSTSSRIKERSDQVFSAEVSSSALDYTNFELSKTYESVNSPKVADDETPQKCLENTENSLVVVDSNPLVPSARPPENVSSRSTDPDELVDCDPFRVVQPFKEFYGVLLERSQESRDMSSLPPSTTADVIETPVIDGSTKVKPTELDVVETCAIDEHMKEKPTELDKSPLCSAEQTAKESQETNSVVEKTHSADIFSSIEDVFPEISSLVEDIQMNSNDESCLSLSDLTCDVVSKPANMIAAFQGTLSNGNLTLLCRVVPNKWDRNCLHSFKMHSYLSYMLSTCRRFGSFPFDFPESRISPSSGYTLPLENENRDFYNSRLFYEETTVARNTNRQLVEVGYFQNYLPTVVGASGSYDDSASTLSNIANGTTSKLIIDWKQIPGKLIHLPCLLEDGNGFKTTVGLTLRFIDNNNMNMFQPTPQDQMFGDIFSRQSSLICSPNFRPQIPLANGTLIPHPALTMGPILDSNMRPIQHVNQMKMLTQKPHNPPLPARGRNGFKKPLLPIVSVPRNLRMPLEIAHATISYPFLAQVIQTSSKPPKPLIADYRNLTNDHKTDEHVAKLHTLNYIENAVEPTPPCTPPKRPIAIIAPTFIEEITKEDVRDYCAKGIVDPPAKRRKTLKENKTNVTPAPREILNRKEFESILSDKECYVPINSNIVRRLLSEKQKSANVKEKRKAEMADLVREHKSGAKRKKYDSEESKKIANGQLNGKRKLEILESSKEQHENGRKKKKHNKPIEVVATAQNNSPPKTSTWSETDSMLRDDLRAMKLEKLESEIDKLLKALTSLPKKPSVEAYFLLNKMAVTFLFECLSSPDCSRGTYNRKYMAFCQTAKKLQGYNVDNVELSKLREKYVELIQNTKSLKSLPIICLVDKTLDQLEKIKTNLFSDEWLHKHTSHIQRHKHTVLIERSLINKMDQNPVVLAEKKPIVVIDSPKPLVATDEEIMSSESETEISEQPTDTGDDDEEKVSKSPNVQFNTTSSAQPLSDHIYTDQLIDPSILDQQFIQIRPMRSDTSKDDEISDATLVDYFSLNMGEINLDHMPYNDAADMPLSFCNETEVVSDDVSHLFVQNDQFDHEADGLIGKGAGTFDNDDEEFLEFKEYARLQSQSANINDTFDAFLENGLKEKIDGSRLQYEAGFENRFYIPLDSDNNHIDFPTHASTLISPLRAPRPTYSPIESDESSLDESEVDTVPYNVVS